MLDFFFLKGHLPIFFNIILLKSLLVSSINLHDWEYSPYEIQIPMTPLITLATHIDHVLNWIKIIMNTS